MKKAIFFILIFFGIIIFLANIPIKFNEDTIEGFNPIRDDQLADKFKPSFIIAQEDFNKPVKLYYRASKDQEGNTYIAYHPVWNGERNNEKGILPTLNRIIYTGGLNIQKLMFGKGDVESIEIVIDNNDKIKSISYETCKDYNPNAFSVKHKEMKVDNPVMSEGVVFKVISWNHLFEYCDKNDDLEVSSDEMVSLKPEYFTKKLWNDYKVFKKRETLLKKNRAHFIYEREDVGEE